VFLFERVILDGDAIVKQFVAEHGLAVSSYVSASKVGPAGSGYHGKQNAAEHKPISHNALAHILPTIRPVYTVHSYVRQRLINAETGQVDFVDLARLFLIEAFHRGLPTASTLRNGVRHFREAQRGNESGR
jgi:hypothetical protein